MWIPQRNLPTTEGQGFQSFFSVPDRFLFIHILEVCFLGTVKIFRGQQVSVTPKFRLRQVSLTGRNIWSHIPDNRKDNLRYEKSTLFFNSPLLYFPLWHSWLNHCATSRKAADSIPDYVIGNFH